MRYSPRAAARLLSPARLFVDVGRDVSTSILVVGSPRSGTTWLAELLARATRSRLIFEPLNPFRSRVAPASHSWTRFLEPSASDPELEAVLGRILHGRLRSYWTDRRNTRRVARRRVIKCVAATNLLPWIRGRYPDLRIVYVVRHPFAECESVDNLVERGRPTAGFGRYVSSLEGAFRDSALLEGPLRDQVDVLSDAHSRAVNVFRKALVLWCLANLQPLTTGAVDWSSGVFYEELVSEGESEWTRVADALHIRSRPVSLRRASSADFRHRGESADSDADRIAGWRRSIRDDDRHFGLALLADLGLDHIYGDHPFPRTSIQALQARGAER